MKIVLVTPAVLEPVSLSELRMHLRLDSSSLADTLEEIQTIAPGLKIPAVYTGDAVEVLGYNAIVEFAAGTFIAGATADVQIKDSDDNLTYANWSTPFIQVTTDGMLTSAALAIGSTPANVANGLFTYFIAGVAYSKPAFGAGTSPATGTADDTIPQGKYGAVGFEIGMDNTIDAIDAADNDTGYTTAELALAGLTLVAVQAGHVRIGSITAMCSAGGAFIFGTTSLAAANTIVTYTSTALKGNYNLTYEKAYTGTKGYIKAVTTVAGANCSLGISIIRMAATSVEDDWLNDAIAEARQYVEDVTRRGILTQTWDYYLQEWPDGDRLKIPFGNLQTVTHIKYKESDWASVADDKTLTLTTDYLVETNGDQCGFIVLPYCGSWPSATLYPSNPITIRFVCGWTTAALVARNLRAMIKLHCADKYKHRGEGITGHVFVEDKAFYRLRMIETLWDEF